MFQANAWLITTIVLGLMASLTHFIAHQPWLGSVVTGLPFAVAALLQMRQGKPLGKFTPSGHTAYFSVVAVGLIGVRLVSGIDHGGTFVAGWLVLGSLTAGIVIGRHGLE